MSPRKPFVNLTNFFIMDQMLFQMLALGLMPMIAISFTVITLSTAWSYCAAPDFGALIRAGSVIQIIAFGYILVEEIWRVTPQNMSDEIEASFAAMMADSNPDAALALLRFRTFAAWSTAVHKPLVRMLEASLVILGGVLNSFGDLIGSWL